MFKNQRDHSVPPIWLPVGRPPAPRRAAWRVKPYVVALLLIWSVPFATLYAFQVGMVGQIPSLAIIGFLGTFLAGFVAIILTAVVLPLIAVGQAVEAERRRRRG